MRTTLKLLQAAGLLALSHAALASAADAAFEALAARYVDEFPALAPVSTTYLGDHRFDGQLNEVTAEARDTTRAFNQRFLTELGAIERSSLSRANQVDALLLENELKSTLAGVVTEVAVSEGDTVETSALLVVVTPPEGD